MNPLERKTKRDETREELIAAIQKCAAEVGRTPTIGEVRRSASLTKFAIQKHFVTFELALRACGLEPKGPGYTVSEMALFLDWAAVVRKLGKVPTVSEYELDGCHTVRPMKRLYQSWANVPVGMLEFAKANQMESEWADVLDVVTRYIMQAEEEGRTPGRTGGPYPGPDRRSNAAGRRLKLPEGQPTYGMPLLPTPLSHSPTNELGVVFLFGAVARELGFMVMRLQAAFPDCEAMYEIEPGRWQRVRIEFEFESRNFVSHMHAVEECDLIVCWNHNWRNCPLEVLELRKLPMLQELPKTE
jgi:hypothetical protein